MDRRACFDYPCDPLTNGLCPERTNNMTNIPTSLVTKFATLTNEIEEAIRQDEREKMLREQVEIRARASEAFLDMVFADHKGKGIRQLVKRPKPNSKVGKLFTCLATRTYAVNRDTLARHSGMTRGSVQKGIQELRGRGYTIECNRRGSKPKYKLVA